MPVGATVALVGAASAANQSRQAGKAADAQGRAAQAGQQEYLALNQPYLSSGTSALSRLERLNSGDFSAFEESPDYRFAFDQGNEAILRGAASRGALNAGGTDVDLQRFGQGLASQNYGNYYSRLANLAQLGQQSAQAAGGQAVGAQNQIGQAQAGGAINSANAWGNFASGLGGLAGQYQGQGAFNPRQSSFQGQDFGQVQRQQIPIPQYNPMTGGYNG